MKILFAAVQIPKIGWTLFYSFFILMFFHSENLQNVPVCSFWFLPNIYFSREECPQIPIEAVRCWCTGMPLCSKLTNEKLVCQIILFHDECKFDNENSICSYSFSENRYICSPKRSQDVYMFVISSEDCWRWDSDKYRFVFIINLKIVVYFNSLFLDHVFVRKFHLF